MKVDGARFSRKLILLLIDPNRIGQAGIAFGPMALAVLVTRVAAKLSRNHCADNALDRDAPSSLDCFHNVGTIETTHGYC